MFGSIVRIKDFDRENKRREKKAKFQQKLRSIGSWVNRNKEIIIVLSPIIIGGAVSGCKGIARSIRLKKAQNLHDLYCYDRSLGHYWRLKRELSNSEWVSIDRRKKNGERLADILSDLRVLK